MTKTALTYDDIQLVPSFSDVKSRGSINLNTLLSRRYGLLNPIVASPMDTVCELDMALRMAELGGVGCIHRFMSITHQSDIVEELQNRIYDESDGLSIAEDWGVMYDTWHSEVKAVPIMAAIGVQEEDKSRALSSFVGNAYLFPPGSRPAPAPFAFEFIASFSTLFQFLKKNEKRTLVIFFLT
jgi:IMP dehydrogenase/GMP reductase